MQKNKFPRLLAIAFCPPLTLNAATVLVSGMANPFLAGMPAGSVCCSDAAPMPAASLTGPVLSSGMSLTFAVTGRVSDFGATPGDPPDGNGNFFSMSTHNGIAGAAGIPQNSLLGVFLDDTEPDFSTPPSPLDFGVLGLNFTSLAPGLKQIFFIGDGLTGSGTGIDQTFFVPMGATRLSLGASDGFQWSNNTGSF